MEANRDNLAYIIGVALGDGNLSNPNGRAVRLRITCDRKYPKVISKIINSLKQTFPKNKISVINRKDACVDISCYSNKLESYLGWRAGNGSKFEQKVSVPDWINLKREYILNCLRGLFETDGSIYLDRKYITVNFVTIIPTLHKDVVDMINTLGFRCNTQIHKQLNRQDKYTIRISKDAGEFVSLVGIGKN